jgi:hypothetical protein
MCKDDVGDAMVEDDVLLEIWNALEPLCDVLRMGEPLPPATPPAGYASSTCSGQY